MNKNINTIRKEVKKVIVSKKYNLSFFIKSQNVLPQFIAYCNMKDIISYDGIIFVPKHQVFENNKGLYLIVEGVIYQNRDAKKWFEDSGVQEEYYFEKLAESLTYLLLQISKIRNKDIILQNEMNDIFNNFPNGVNVKYYKKYFQFTCGEIYISFNKTQYLVPRDLYNNILVGYPWSMKNYIKICTPLSIIDFGETYKFCSLSEIIAEILVIWKHHSNIDINKKWIFVRSFVDKLKSSEIWNQREIEFFLAIWEIRDLMWRGDKDENEILKVCKLVKKIFYSEGMSQKEIENYYEY